MGKQKLVDCSAFMEAFFNSVTLITEEKRAKQHFDTANIEWSNDFESNKTYI